MDTVNIRKLPENHGIFTTILFSEITANVLNKN